MPKTGLPQPPTQNRLWFHALCVRFPQHALFDGAGPVSYTHLTLPTIYSV